MDVLLQDLKYGLRSLRRTPGFTAVVIAMMALGIGVNTMVFSMVYGVLLRPLPLPESQRLVAVSSYETTRSDPHEENEISQPMFLALRDRARSFETIGGYWNVGAYVRIDQDIESFDGANVTSNLFAALGLTPQLGRFFTRDEEAVGNNWSTVIISDRMWRTRYGARHDAIGRTLRMNGRTRTIVGVLPPGVRFPENQDFFIPMPFDPNDMKWTDHSVDVVGRLAPGVTVKQASAEVAAIARDLARAHVEIKNERAVAAPLRAQMSADIAPMMTMMMISVIFVLLIACANIANLLLARGASRQREIAMRFAVGASRARIVRQLLTESAVLAVAGALLGILLAQWITRFYLALVPLEFPYYMRFDIDGVVLTYTVIAAAFSALVFGLAPALQASDSQLGDAIREGSVQTGTSRRGDRMRGALVVAEIALSLVLLVGAGLMMRSFLKITGLSHRIRTDNMLTGRLLMPIAIYPDEPARRAAMRTLFPQVARLPGVLEVAGTTLIPLNKDNWNARVRPEGWRDSDPHSGITSCYTAITPGYFQTIGLPLRRGRHFESTDDEHASRVAIVDEALARKLWPGTEALGRRLRFAGEADSLGMITVVGVVDDIPNTINKTKSAGAIYVPHMQSTEQVLSLVIHTAGSPGALAGPLRGLFRSNYPDMPLSKVQTLDEFLSFTRWESRLFTSLFATFALLALIIAGVGIYGVMAYAVAQRTREIGIRMALGAAGNQVVGLVVGKAMRLAVLGCGIGLAGAYALTRLMASELFGVSANDPPTYAGVAVILALSAITAAWVPAYRATRVDPIVALRHE